MMTLSCRASLLLYEDNDFAVIEPGIPCYYNYCSADGTECDYLLNLKTSKYKKFNGDKYIRYYGQTSGLLVSRN